MLFPGDASAAVKIGVLLNYVNTQMVGTGLTGFATAQGDINGDGTGNGTGPASCARTWAAW